MTPHPGAAPLGQLPSGWRADRLKLHLARNDGGAWGDDPDGEGDTIVLRSTEQTIDGRWSLEEPALRRLTREEREATRLLEGDLVVTKSSGSSLHIGKTTIVDSEVLALRCGYSNFMQRLRTAPSLIPRFAWYLLNHSLVRKQFDVMSSSTTGLANLNAGLIGSVLVPVPPAEEQVAIVLFLDRETAKIDALVEEQRRLIELLKEKRQAVISHAVTKGLYPNVKMKPSGVEWLGDVPAHWDVAPCGYRYQGQLGRMLNEERSRGDDLRPYLRVFDVQWGAINTDDLPVMDFPQDARERYRLSPGDLLVNEGGSYVGRSAIWRGELEECYYQKALHRLRPHDHGRDSSDFLLFVMEMATKMGVFVAGGNQTTIDHLTAEQLRSQRLPFPPFEEQMEISRFVSRETDKLNRLESQVIAATDLLTERRSALISAAVTGKIDVRDHQLAEEAAA